MGRVQQASDLVWSLADVSLPNPSSEQVRLGELWRERTIVLIHLRHFGCILCRHYAARLRDHHAQFLELGAEIVAIGTGGRDYARRFVEERQIDYPVLVDRDLTTHELIGVKSGPPIGVLRPRVLGAGIKALAAGEVQGKTGPHPFLFGAAHVIAGGGTLVYAWVNQDYHDNAPIPELLAAVRA